MFRLFDILKIGFADSAEKLPGGSGIVADDCVGVRGVPRGAGVRLARPHGGYDWCA